jgi:hypothetical protein
MARMFSAGDDHGADPYDAIEPDTKDWTWVLDRPCPDCGFDAGTVAVDRLPVLLRDNADAWRTVLTRPDAIARPAPAVWSPLEYGCHVRDVHALFAQRVRLMLAEDDPQFANWDQDETAVEQRYVEQRPEVVLPALLAAADEVAGVYGSVGADQWDRPGRRSNGSVFTVATIGRYHLHDVVHHLHDVRG